MTLFYNLKKNEIIEDIYLKKNLVIKNYPKYYFRKTQELLSIVDNQIDLKNSTLSNSKCGESILLKTDICINNELKLKFLWLKTKQGKSDVNKFIENFQKIKKILFLKPIKGGIGIYSAGLKGLLLLEDAKNIIRTICINRHVFNYILKPAQNSFYIFPLIGKIQTFSLYTTTTENTAKHSKIVKPKNKNIVIFVLKKTNKKDLKRVK